MNHASLFSGIGGFDLAAQWMGWENKLHCEINPFCRKILSYYWPKAISYEDIKTTDFTIWRGRIDILTGGFPCQPYSSAGKRLGKEDERHLWPEMLRAIREIKPRWIVGENVAGLLTWNGGLVFKELCTDLENEGYEVQAFIIPACAIGAPHRRDRVWIIACTNNNPKIRTSRRNEEKIKNKRLQKRNEVQFAFESDYLCQYTSKTHNIGHEIWAKRRQQNRTKAESGVDDSIERLGNFGPITNTKMPRSERKRIYQSRKIQSYRRNCKNIQTDFKNFPTQSPVCSGDDGLPTELDGITFPKWRNESIKGYGNAVVPQVVYEIFKAIENIEKNA